jgi:predicted O-methyltransferase YrrM
MPAALRLLGETIRSANLNVLRLYARDDQLAREYWSQMIQRYGELMGLGLPHRDPVEFIYEQGWATRSGSERSQIPAMLNTAGGTRLDELAALASVTAVLRPSRVFEIGTFMGRTTSVFVMNAGGGEVITMDLPVDAPVMAATTGAGYIDTDVTLIAERRVGSVLRELGLEHRYRQLYADSLQFEPAPYADSVELGFIDGAHAREYVENDTRKMAVMLADRGLVFWHDYGGRGRFRELTEYLEGLARRIPMYRVQSTSLAWAPAKALKGLFA